MALPPLYKYLSVQGAKLTLGNRAFRHAKPSDFNDIEDMTIQSIFPEETEVALKKLSEGIQDVILAHLNDPPTCASPMREKLELIQQLYRKNPKVADLVKAEIKKGKPLFDVEHMRARATAYIEEINAFMQGWRVLCVTIKKDSERMWSEYSENHKGIVLRIEPNVTKDSKFQLFRPVIYRDKRPAFYDDTVEFIAESLFGDQEARTRAIMAKIIYAKSPSSKVGVNEGWRCLEIAAGGGSIAEWLCHRVGPKMNFSMFIGKRRSSKLHCRAMRV